MDIPKEIIYTINRLTNKHEVASLDIIYNRIVKCRMCPHLFESNKIFKCFICKCKNDFIVRKDGKCPHHNSRW